MVGLHVDTIGSGAPLLLVHGWGMHGGVWKHVATKLAQHFRVHCVDLPGHGFNRNFPFARHSRESGNPAKIKVPRSGQNNDVDPLSREFFNQLDSRLRGNDVIRSNGKPEFNVGRDLSRLDSVGINPDLHLDTIVDELSAQFSEPLAICGWSLGGQIALRWAIRHPQQINRLVLVATTPCFVQRPNWPCAMAAETLTEFSVALQEDFAQTLRRFVTLQMRGSDRERELLADLRQRLFDRGEPDVAALQGGLEILRNTDLRAQLSQITQATLVISGERDMLTPLPAAKYLAQNLPAARLVKIAGAAHAPFLSHPDSFIEHVTDFMHE